MLFIDPSSHDIGRSPSSAPAAFTPSVRWGLALESEDFELSPTARSDVFSFHLLGGDCRLLPSYWDLRSRIFCQEQHLFEASDRDELDARAYPIVALPTAAPGPERRWAWCGSWSSATGCGREAVWGWTPSSAAITRSARG